MQLKKPRRIREGLAAATCALLTPSTHGASGAQWEVDSAVLTYSEKDRVTVIEPVIQGRRVVGEEDFLNLRLTFDTMTGSSPNGASPSSTAQTFTGASGEDSYTTPANETPLREFSDSRVAASLEFEKTHSSVFRGAYEINGSVEGDYFSAGASTTLSRDFNSKMTTLSAGLSGSVDLIKPEGGAPDALTLMSAVPAGSGDDDDDEHEDEDVEVKLLADVLLGVTQVINRKTLMQFNYTFGRSQGYLTDPYKILSVVNSATGATMDYRFEKRPDSRNRQTLYWKTVRYLGGDVVHLAYRYYWDDWDIRSHTVDLKYRLQLGEKQYLQPHVRVYNQTAASFYRHSLVALQPVPASASADFRLGEMRAYTLGLKYARKIGRAGEWSVRAEYMRQSGDSHPDDAIGLQREQDLFPDLDVVILQVGYSGAF